MTYTLPEPYKPEVCEYTSAQMLGAYNKGVDDTTAAQDKLHTLSAISLENSARELATATHERDIARKDVDSIRDQLRICESNYANLNRLQAGTDAKYRKAIEENARLIASKATDADKIDALDCLVQDKEVFINEVMKDMPEIILLLRQSYIRVNFNETLSEKLFKLITRLNNLIGA